MIPSILEALLNFILKVFVDLYASIENTSESIEKLIELVWVIYIFVYVSNGHYSLNEYSRHVWEDCTPREQHKASNKSLCIANRMQISKSYSWKWGHRKVEGDKDLVVKPSFYDLNGPVFY